MLRLLSPLRLRRGRGVKAILTRDDEVLLVMHTYGPRRWELPGGGVRRAETPLDGIRRELREEIAVALEATELRALGVERRRANRRVHYFTAELAPSVAIEPDQREIARAQWHRRGALPVRLRARVAQALDGDGHGLATAR